MNVQEMHIEFNISSQKVRSNYYRKFLPSEIDWIFNKEVGRFIKDRIKKDQDSLGFDATQIDLDALRTLVVLDRQLRTFNIEPDAVRAELPGNYAHLIDDFSNTIDKCDIRNYNLANKPAAGNIYIYSFPLAESTKGAPPYYQSMSLQLNGTSVFSVSGLPGLQDKSELFTVRNYILDQLSIFTSNLMQTSPLTTIDFYWEEFGGVRKPNSILAVTTVQQPGLNQLSLDTLNIAGVETIISRPFYPLVNTGKLSVNRLIKGAFRSQVRASTFMGTKASSPISAVTGNQIKVYSDGKFIVSKLSISYIRKPAKINLLLNQNCDLPEEFHQEICDRAVLYIKELTLSPDWEIKLRDMMTNKD